MSGIYSYFEYIGTAAYDLTANLADKAAETMVAYAPEVALDLVNKIAEDGVSATVYDSADALANAIVGNAPKSVLDLADNVVPWVGALAICSGTALQNIASNAADALCDTANRILNYDKTPEELQTVALINLLENFKNRNAIRDSDGIAISIPASDKEANYYLGLLVKQLLKNRSKKNESKDSEIMNISDDIVRDRLTKFAKKHLNDQNGAAGKGAEIFVSAILAGLKINDKDVLEYIDKNLNLTRKEYVLMKAKHVLDTIKKVLSYLDEKLGIAFKQPIYLAINMGYIIAPDKTDAALQGMIPDYSEGIPGIYERAETIKLAVPHALKHAKEEFKNHGMKGVWDKRKNIQQQTVKDIAIKTIKEQDTLPSTFIKATAKSAKKNAIRVGKKAGMEAKKVSKSVSNKINKKKPKKF